MKRVGVDIGSSVVGANKIRNPQAVSLALSRALQEAEASKYGFILGLASPEAAVAQLVLPAAIKPGERIGSIRADGRAIAPTLPLVDSALSTNVLRIDTTGEGTAAVTLVVAAALRSEVDLLRQVCKLSNCVPQAIDLAGAATMRALVRDRLNSAVVDLGMTKVTIVTREGLHVRSIRTAPGGGTELTRAIAGAGEWTFQEAEARKRSMHVGTRSTAPSTSALEEPGAYSGYGIMEETTSGEDVRVMQNVEDAVNAAVDSLVDQVAQSIEIDADLHHSMTRGVTLCGGTSLLRGLKDRLQQRIGAEVHVGRPWAHLESSKRHAAHFRSGVEDPQLLLQLTTATGLALWRKEQ